jgi:arylsulfatase A-like enzyme
VLFSNRKIAIQNPGIEDMAPTALDLFGIQPPPHMEGKSLLNSRTEPAEKAEVAA